MLSSANIRSANISLVLYYAWYASDIFPSCQIATQKFSVMILTFDFQIDCQDEHQYADFLHNLQAILIKQTQSELIATHAFLHKRSSGMASNWKCSVCLISVFSFNTVPRETKCNIFSQFPGFIRKYSLNLTQNTLHHSPQYKKREVNKKKTS